MNQSRRWDSTTFLEAPSSNDLIPALIKALKDEPHLTEIRIFEHVGTHRYLPIWQKKVTLRRQKTERGFKFGWASPVRDHPHAILTFNRKEAKIDQPCVDFVPWLNQQGYPTASCCQGDPRNPYHILFQPNFPMQAIQHFADDPRLKGCFSLWRNGKGEDLIRYEVDAIEKAQEDFLLIQKLQSLR